MQQLLRRRGTDTPTDIPQVRSTCGVPLNSPEGRDSVAGYFVRHTYGYLTKLGRHSLGLTKSHVNDAFVIAGGSFQARATYRYFINQVRKCNRIF